MRERTPSADDTPKRAPPAPPGEADVACRKATGAASAVVLGACPSATSASAGAGAKCSSSRSIMVASSHGLDELVGVSHISSQQQQQLSKQPTPFAGKSTQDKRSRLSNVIDNLRTKRVAPPTAAATTAMTVLNGTCDPSADVAAELSSDNSQPEEPPAKVVVDSEQREPEAAAADADTPKEPQLSVELQKPKAALVIEDEVGEPRPESSSSGSSPIRTLGDIILERLNQEVPVVVDDSKALNDACSELVTHLVDQAVASVEADVVVPLSQPQQQRQPPEGLCCSVPLDKVASVLQQQTTTATTTTCQQQEQKRTTSTRHLCLYCDRKFPSIPVRQKHVERFHQASLTVGRRSERNQPKQCNGSSAAQQQQSCQYCERPEGGLDGLFRHMVGSHSDRYHGCLPCRTRYLTRDALATHLLAEHVNDSKPKEPDIPELLDSGGGGSNALGGIVMDAKLAKCPEVASNSSGSNAVMPIDISLTAATPVYKDEGTMKQESEEPSELAGKPGRAGIRAHPRRVSFEKYNFPRKYDGKEQWSCSIKDLSRFDISTQLSLRRKQQQRQLLGDEGCTSLTEEQFTPLVEEAAEPLQDECSSASGVVSCGDSGVVVSDDKCEVADCGDDASAGERTLEGAQFEAEKQLELEAKVKTEPTLFSGEFESFMRLAKWNKGSNRHRNFELVYAELTGEWSRPRIYICAACADKYVTLKELEEHKQAAHPNVWCVHFEFSGEQRELHKHLVFLPSPSNVSTFVECPNSSSVKTRQQILNSQPPEKVCTKCSKLCASLSELHRHMLECGGDQTWLLGLFGASNGKKKCKWRPFGSRRRRQRGMKRNINKSQTPRNNCAPPRERPSYSGPRVRPSDRESIQKMLANLPAKRATRKVLQENAARSQSRLRNVQSRSLATDSQESRLVASKAARRNKLLKNAKSFQRKKNLLQEKREQQQQQADEDEAAASAAAQTEPPQLKPRKLLRVLAKRVKISSSSSRSKAQQSRQLRSSGLPATPEDVVVPQQQDSSPTAKQVERKVKVVKKVHQLKSKIKAKSKPEALASLDSKSVRIGTARLLTRSKLRAAAKLAWREHERISRRVTRLRSLEEPQPDVSQTQPTSDDQQQQSDRPRRSKREEEQPKPNKIEARISRSSSLSLDGAKKKSLEAKLPVVLVPSTELKQRSRSKRDQQAKEPQQQQQQLGKGIDVDSSDTSTERRTSRRLSLVAVNEETPKKDSCKTQPLRKSTRNKEVGDAEALEPETTTPETSPAKDELSGKRRSSLRRQAVEVTEEVSSPPVPEGETGKTVLVVPEDDCSSLTTTTSDKQQSSPIEVLQHESSNSNLDSGKENYSAEPVSFQQTQTKVKVARPRKTRHQSRKGSAGAASSSAKRSLNSVIGILTEGVNVPIVETAIVLTVLTSHDAEQQGNPACHGPSTAQPVASSSSQQPVVPVAVSSASESASQEQQQQQQQPEPVKPAEAPTTTTTTTTGKTEEKKPDESQACSSGASAAAEQQPANDIIRDLARRKPKGKGSFLEKIVSKIAKSKDVSLEGGDGGCCSLLDVVSRNSTNLVASGASAAVSTVVSGVNSAETSSALGVDSGRSESVSGALSALSDAIVTQVTFTEPTTTHQLPSSEAQRIKDCVEQPSCSNRSVVVNGAIETTEMMESSQVAIPLVPVNPERQEEPKTDQESSRPSRDTSPRKNRRKPVSRENVTDSVAKPADAPRTEATPPEQNPPPKEEIVTTVGEKVESSTNNARSEAVLPAKTETRRKGTARSLRRRGGPQETVAESLDSASQNVDLESDSSGVMDLSTHRSTTLSDEKEVTSNTQTETVNPCVAVDEASKETKSAESVEVVETKALATSQVTMETTESSVAVSVVEATVVDMSVTENVAQTSKSSRRRKKVSKDDVKSDQNCTKEPIVGSEVSSTVVVNAGGNVDKVDKIESNGVEIVGQNQNEQLPVSDSAQSFINESVSTEKSSKRKKKASKRSNKSQQKLVDDDQLQAAPSLTETENTETINESESAETRVRAESSVTATQSEQVNSEDVSDAGAKSEASATVINGVMPETHSNDQNNESTSSDIAHSTPSEITSRRAKSSKSKSKASKKNAKGTKNVQEDAQPQDDSAITSAEYSGVTESSRTENEPTLSGLDAVIAEVSSSGVRPQESDEEIPIPVVASLEIKTSETNDVVANVDGVQTPTRLRTSKSRKTPKRKVETSKEVPEVEKAPEPIVSSTDQSPDLATTSCQVSDGIVAEESLSTNVNEPINADVNSSKTTISEQDGKLPEVDLVESSAPGKRNKSSKLSKRKPKSSKKSPNVTDDLGMDNSHRDNNSLPIQDTGIPEENQTLLHRNSPVPIGFLSNTQSLAQDIENERLDGLQTSTPVNNRTSKRKTKGSNKKVRIAENTETSAELSNIDVSSSSVRTGADLTAQNHAQDNLIGQENEAVENNSVIPAEILPKTQEIKIDSEVENVVDLPSSAPNKKSKTAKRKAKGNSKKARVTENFETSADLSKTENSLPLPMIDHRIVDLSATRSIDVELGGEPKVENSLSSSQETVPVTRLLEGDGKIHEPVSTTSKKGKSSKRKTKASSKRIRISEKLESDTATSDIDMTNSTIAAGDETFVGVVSTSVTEPEVSEPAESLSVAETETPSNSTKSKKSSKQKKKSSKSSNKSHQDSEEAHNHAGATGIDSNLNAAVATEEATEISEKLDGLAYISPSEIGPAISAAEQADASDDPTSIKVDIVSNIVMTNDKVSERSKRASKRSSEVFAELETSNDHVSDVPEESFKMPESIETSKSSRKRVTKKKISAINDSASKDLGTAEIEISEKSNAYDLSVSLADSTDEDISAFESDTSSRRLSRRSTRTCRNVESTAVKESDDSDVSSANEMDTSQPRRSQRSKNVPDSSRDSSVSSIDVNVSSIGEVPEKKQMPSRRAKKNVSLVDDHLELPSDTDTPNESVDQKTGASGESRRMEESIEEAAKNTVKNSTESKIVESQVPIHGAQSQIEEEKTEEVEKSEDKHPKTPESQLSSVDENDDGIEENQKSLVSEADEPNNQDLQAPKKRLAGNFAIVTKSGKILIVEKKKKLTKEVARFFCDVCSTSFTRKSSLKKHNLSQSHILQATMSCDKEVAKEIQELVDASSQPKKLQTSKVSEPEESKGAEIPEIDEKIVVADEKTDGPVGVMKEKDTECEPSTVGKSESTSPAEELVVESGGTSIDLSMPKASESVMSSPLIIPEPLFSHKSPEDELEDEMLDEEICKITENMSHDEYVLTDHVSPVTPEAASTPIKDVKALEKLPLKPAPKQKKKKKEKEKKKRNLADEHLSLDTPAPAVVEPPPPVVETQNTSDVSLEDSELNAEVAMITDTLEVEQAEVPIPTAVSGKREPRSKKTVVETVDEEPSELRRTGRNRTQNAAQTLPTTEGKENSRPRRNQLRPSYKEDENTDLEPIESPMPKQQSETEKDGVFVEPRELSRSRRDKSNVTVTESETSDVEKETGAKKAKSKKKQSKRRSGRADTDELPVLDDEVLKKIDSGIIADVPAEESNPEESSATEAEIEPIGEQPKLDETRNVVDLKKKRNKKQKVPVEEPVTEQVPSVPGENLSTELTESTTVVEEELESILTEEKSGSSSRKQSKSRKGQSKRKKKNPAQEESPDTAVKSDEAALPLETCTKEISTPEKIDPQRSLIHVGETSLDQHNEVSIPSATVAEAPTQDTQDDQAPQQVMESKNEPARLDPGFDSDENSLDTDNMSVDIQKLLDDPEMTSELAQQVDEDSQEAGNIDVLNIKEPLPVGTSDTDTVDQNETRSSSGRRKPSSSKKSSKSRRQTKKSEIQADESKGKVVEQVPDEEAGDDNEQRADDSHSSQEELNKIGGDTTPAADLSDVEESTVVARSLRNRSAGSTKRSEVNPSSSGRSRQSKRRAEELISRAFHDDSPLLSSDGKRTSQRQSRKSQQSKPAEDVVPEPAPADQSDEEVEQEPLPPRQGPSSEPEDNSCTEDEEPLPEYGRTSSPTSDDLLDDDEVSVGCKLKRNPRTVSKSEEELTIETATEPEEDDDEDEDNTLEYDRTAQEHQHQQQQHQQQPTKVLNFDEELFVECCSRLKASSENELRGAKKIKLDHSASMDHAGTGQYRHHQQFHRRDDGLGAYRSKDRWRDVESQNSLGSLLESVNQLLGEEQHSNEKDYPMHGSSKRRSHHHHHHHHHHSKHHKRTRVNRSASPDELLSDGDDEADDNLGYDDSLDVAFEHNNKLRDKIQQRMRESESLIATSFAKSSPTVESTNFEVYSEFETSFKQQQHHRHKTNNGMSGILDKALSTLLSNEKRDHNGSAPMKLLAELACARAPTSTTPTTPKPSFKNSPEVLKEADSSIDDRKHSADESEQSSQKKPKNPIRELFERKKEQQDKKQVDKIKISQNKSSSNESKLKKQKSKSKSVQHSLPLIRTSQFRGGMAERKKRRDDGKKKQQTSNKSSKSTSGPKDVYDFDEEESPSEIDLPPVLSFRSKTNENSREFSMSALLSKTIGDTLTNGKSISAIGENLESMVDRKFKDIEKFAPQSEDQTASVDGAMDEFVERKSKSKRTSNEHSANKHSSKSKKKNSKHAKKKSRNAWYENDSSDEFVTKLRDDDLQGVGLSKSQRTCSKGKQNLFAEMSSTSSESEFENTMDSEFSSLTEKGRKNDLTKKTGTKKSDDKEAETRQRSISPEPKTTEKDEERWSSRCNGASSVSDTENKKSAESEDLSDQPLVIDESLKELTDQRTTSDAETEDRPYVLDDLYREDSSILDSDRAGDESAVEDKPTTPADPPPQTTEEKTSARKPSRKSETSSSAKKRRQPSKSGSKKKPQRATSLPEKLPSNTKPEHESENLPLHVFLSRKVQQSKKRKQQQELAKLIQEQQRLVADDQPTRRQRKCAIGKQGLLAEFSSSDDEDSPRSRHRQRRRPADEGDVEDNDTNVEEAAVDGIPDAPSTTAPETTSATTTSTTSRPNKPKPRESKEKRRERYIEKKHEQMIAKEQRAIEEAIMRELEEKRLSAASEAGSGTDEHRGNEQTDADVPVSSTKAQQTKEKSTKSSSPRKKPSGGEAAKRKKSTTRSPQKAKKPHRAEAQQKEKEKKDESVVNNGIDKDDDEDLKMGRSWNRVDEEVGVAIGRRKRAAANQLYYWSSSSDDDERQTKRKSKSKQQRSSSQDSTTAPTSTAQSSTSTPGQTLAAGAEEVQEGDRPEQHGWIVGDSHKRMITMLAMEKQMKEKRRRSENDEQAPGLQTLGGATVTMPPTTSKDKSASKKHRNSTS